MGFGHVLWIMVSPEVMHDLRLFSLMELPLFATLFLIGLGFAAFSHWLLRGSHHSRRGPGDLEILKRVRGGCGLKPLASSSSLEAHP